MTTQGHTIGHDPIVSHGRGGAGNVLPDDTPYVDGEITRQGPVGDQGDGAYSSGRGGAGNIESPHLKPTIGKVGDTDVVPEAATRKSGEQNYHTGRGGEGNVHKDDAPVVHEGLADKLKHKILGTVGMGKKNAK